MMRPEDKLRAKAEFRWVLGVEEGVERSRMLVHCCYSKISYPHPANTVHNFAFSC